MSSYYGLNHIINECMDEKAKCNTTARGKSSRAKYEIYQNSWNALNTWIESKLSKQKGAGISGFGNFCWELKQRDGMTHCRPLFILSDTFIKSFKIKQDRIHHLPQTTPIEEVNYSLLAIKFSKNLTKDMVFSGIRDILRKIGDFIYRGYEIEIQFNFGILRSKERRMRFEFNQTRLQQILPEKMEPGVYAYDTSAMAYYDEQSENGDATTGTARTETTEKDWNFLDRETSVHRSSSAIPSLDLTKKNLATLPRATSADNVEFSTQSHPSITFNTAAFNKLSFDNNSTNDKMNDTITGPSSVTSNEGGFGNTAMGKTFSEFEAEANRREALPTELRDLLDTLATRKTGVSKKEFREKAVERVAEQAYMRCLDNVDNSARLDDNTLHESTTMYNDWKDSIARQKEECRQQVRAMKSSLDAQVARNNEKLEKERQEKKNIIMRFILPDNAGMVTGSSLSSSIGPDGKVINSRQKINKDLEQQMKSNMERAQKAREETSHKERDYLKKLALEIDLNNVMERAKHLETQKRLLEAWEREGHIRNLRKLQPHGRDSVRDYMETNLAETTGNMTIARPSTTLGGALNRSIGYDPRRGKVV